MKQGKKENCWEFKRCGREPGGAHVHDLGVCVATEEDRLDGVHGGSFAGRSCWVVAGTLCGGQVQGSFAQKYRNCETCEFYRQVREEEFPKFLLSAVLMKKLETDRK